MELKIDPKELEGAIRDVLALTLTPETKNELITKAIEHLLSRSHYAQGTELEGIMRSAANAVAHKICLEEFDKPETREKIRELFNAAWEKMLGEEDRRDKLIEKMSDKLGEALFGRGY